MKVKVDNEKCFGCGACPSLAPEVFEFNDDGYAQVIVDEVPEDKKEEVQEAIDNCPAGAIEEIK